MRFKIKDVGNNYDRLSNEAMDEFGIQVSQHLYKKVNLKNIRPGDKAANLILTLKDHVLSLEFDYMILLIWNVISSLAITYLLLKK